MGINYRARAWSYSPHWSVAISFMLSTFKSTIPDLTLVIQALERFKDFPVNIKGCAIALYASELALQHGWQQTNAELHLYAIALQLEKEAA